jgi:hypothetical protein
MKQFRVPRKLKKKLKKDLWLYPMNPITKTYLMAHPYYDEKDFKAWKNKIVTGTLQTLKQKHKHGKSDSGI